MPGMAHRKPSSSLVVCRRTREGAMKGQLFSLAKAIIGITLLPKVLPKYIHTPHLSKARLPQWVKDRFVH